MARTNATNFTGSLQFPYATAGTDLFKKEDVQTLALAVDSHDHSSGKGLILAASAIPAGSITSAMIVDGTIATADLAGGAVSQRQVVRGVSSSPTTTSASFVALADMLITITVDVLCDLVISFSGPFSSTNAGAAITLGLSIDGTAEVAIAGFNMPQVSYATFLGIEHVASAGAGTHTVQVRWSTGTGTATSPVTSRVLTVVALKR